MISYAKFLERKQTFSRMDGFDPVQRVISLFDWQWGIVRRACQIGKSAIFADCGLGKTPMQLEWADQVMRLEMAVEKCYGRRSKIATPGSIVIHFL